MEKPPIRPKPWIAQGSKAIRIPNSLTPAMQIRRQRRRERVTLPDLNLSIDETNAPNVNSVSESDRNSYEEPKVYSCNYCQRKFYSSQALGGHQNAHKGQRDIARRGGRNAVPSNSVPNRSNSYSGSSSMASLPLDDASVFNIPLRIQAYSMVQNQTPGALTSLQSSQYHSKSSWTQSFVKKQPEFGSITLQNYNAGADLRAWTSYSAPRFENAVSGSSNMTAAPRFENSRSFASTGDRAGGICEGSPSMLRTKQDDLHKLDLSLKL